MTRREVKNKLASGCLRSEVRLFFLFCSSGCGVVMTAIFHILFAYLLSGTDGTLHI